MKLLELNINFVTTVNYTIVKTIPNSCAEAFKSPDDVTSGS